VEIFGSFSRASEALLSRRFAQRVMRTIPAISTIESKITILAFLISKLEYWNNGILGFVFGLFAEV
jgi:hypothetical protein